MRLTRVLVASLAALGCSSPRVGKPVVWPDPPEKARIRFVTAFRHTHDLDNSGWSRFKRGIFGGSQDPFLSQPMGAAISDDGNRLYVADFARSHVFVADFPGQRVRLFAPGEGMGKPFNVALDADENVYVTDSTGRQVLVFSRKGEKLRAFGKDLVRPTGLAVDRQRKLVYVADSARRDSDKHRVVVYDLEGHYVRDLGPKGGGPTKGDGDGQFHFPTYLAVDSQGNVYVADTMNFRIQVFDAEGKFVKKFGEHGDGPGAFARIKGLALDSFDNLYVVDGGHSNVQLFNKNFDVLMFFGGYAQRLEYFDVPSGIAIDRRTNRIYVCNEFISRVNVYELINTTAEDSTPKPAPANAPATANTP